MEIVLIAVQSLDGRLTELDAPGTGFASDEDRRLFPELIAACDAIVMGAGTYVQAKDRIRANLSVERLRFVMTRRPELWVEEHVPGRLEFTAGGPAEIVDRLRRLGKRRLGVLGGGQVNRLFLQAGLVDELWLTLEPVVFGGGVPLSDGACQTRFRIREVRQLSPKTLFIRYIRDSKQGGAV
jgi:riboflavin biosynthesis pyrimidine reductase